MGSKHRLPSGIKSPTVITIEVDGVVVDFNGFLELPLKEVVLFGKDLRVFQANVMLGHRGVLSQGRLIDPIMSNVSNMLFDPSVK